MKIAGRRLRAYSIVIHRGRRSGPEYRNPVGAYPLGDGFAIAILYGRQSHWVKNVMATGSLTLRTKGQDHRLERPEIIPRSEALAAYPRLWRWTLRRQQIDEFIWAHRAARRAVIDWIDLTYNNPGVDLMLYWSLLPPEGRRQFRDVMDTSPMAVCARILSLFICSTLAVYGHHEGMVELTREVIAGLDRTIHPD